MDVGFIGLGSMGSRIVNLLLAGGHTVTAWARRPVSLEPFAGMIHEAASPRDVARSSELVGLCVWDEQDIEDVLLRADGVLAGLNPGAVVSIHSTISPAACQRLAHETRQAGGHLIDAAVSVGAALPKVLMMVGGEETAVAKCRPALSAVGDPLLHLGPVGSGQLAKLVNNTMVTATIGLGEDAVAFGAELGLDPAVLAAALAAGSAGGTWTRFVSATAGRPRDPHATEWARKDVGLAREVAAQAGLVLDRDLLRLADRGIDVVG
jgi:3-hydroxyisobutyrate dehydrogenase